MTKTLLAFSQEGIKQYLYSTTSCTIYMQSHGLDERWSESQGRTAHVRKILKDNTVHVGTYIPFPFNIAQECSKV